MDIRNALKEFMLTPAPSGYEGEMAKSLRIHMERFCDKVYIDKIGNCIGLIKGNEDQGKTSMIFGHMDQLGFIVRKIEENGFIQVDRLGGIPEKVLPGLKLRIRTEDGDWVTGVFGPKAHHATPAEEKYKVDPVTSLYIDIGAESKLQVNNLGIYVGCPVVYEGAYDELLNGRVVGTSIDNRGACAALVQIAEELSQNRPRGDVYLVGTVWEEFNLRGAMIAARTIHPDLAISLDVVWAGDTNDRAAKDEGKMGGGAWVPRSHFHGLGTLKGTLPNEKLFRLAKECAKEEKMALQRFASIGILTDSAYIQLEEEGVPVLEMGFPARYTHTPVEVCDPGDISALAHLCSAMMRKIDRTFDLSRFSIE